MMTTNRIRIRAGIEETSKHFEAMIIANQGENFSVGANLMMVLLASQEGEWDELDAAILKMIDSPKPVLFDCIVDQMENCYPMIPSGAAHNEMILCDADEEAANVSDAGKMLV